MKTKKIISSIMVISAVAILSSCGKDKSSSNDNKTTSENSQPLPELRWMEVDEEEFYTAKANMKTTDLRKHAVATPNRGFTYTNYVYEKKDNIIKINDTKYDVDFDMDNCSCRISCIDKISKQNSNDPEDGYEKEVKTIITASYFEQYGYIYSKKTIENGEETSKNSTIYTTKEQVDIDVRFTIESGHTKEDALRIYAVSFLDDKSFIESQMWLYSNIPAANKYDNKKFANTNITNRSQKYYLSERDAFDFRLNWNMAGSYDNGYADGYKVNYEQIDKGEIIDGVATYGLDSYKEIGSYYVTSDELVDFEYNAIQEFVPKQFESFAIPSIEEYPFVSDNQ